LKSALKVERGVLLTSACYIVVDVEGNKE